MKVRINEECSGCFNCEAVFPKVFRINDLGKPELLVEKINPSLLQGVKKAIAECPSECIFLEDSTEDTGKAVPV